MSTPQERLHEATRRLLDLLEAGEATTAETLAVREELARATADLGHLQDAWYQVDELRKDALRTHGPDHPVVASARALQADIEERAGGAVEDGA
ncbi:hypothetical protein V1260_08550 [Brachybacterium sp. J144]|uniref:hypothetical protein n=1 Tax=Brachybacterium sp. J144 TaxID=3116487 RepID=UPI002E75D0E2|nr:hypothetical protein [Brachybacterium sp. J144]MEE1650840.1 hypothetical protein [Brachybacterium sp. J144]